MARPLAAAALALLLAAGCASTGGASSSEGARAGEPANAAGVAPTITTATTARSDSPQRAAVAGKVLAVQRTGDQVTLTLVQPVSGVTAIALTTSTPVRDGRRQPLSVDVLARDVDVQATGLATPDGVLQADEVVVQAVPAGATTPTSA